MFKANYHTHTKRCGHAYNEDEEYVLKAIEGGFDTIGFSDHIMLPGFSQPTMRGDYSLCQDYYDSINFLKEKYKEQIELHLGFEAESIPEYFPYFTELIQNGIIEYLVLGNHFLMDNKKNIIKYFSRCNTASDLYNYLEFAEKAIKSHLYRIFAHPDIFLSNVENFDNDCYKVSKKLIELAVENEVFLEVNCGSVRTGKKEIGDRIRYCYPNSEFFQIVNKYNVPCLIGIDAHGARDFVDEQSLSYIANFVKENNIKIVDHIDLKTILSK